MLQPNFPVSVHKGSVSENRNIKLHFWKWTRRSWPYKPLTNVIRTTRTCVKANQPKRQVDKLDILFRRLYSEPQ